ncbi:MAG: glycosyltransferase, partial [Nitrososphaera sp.]
ATDLPENISLITSGDIEIARLVISSVSPSHQDNGVEIFRVWKKTVIERRSQYREELAPAAIPKESRIRRPGPLRVLYVSNASAFSGAEDSLCQLVASLDRTRFEPLALIGMRGVLTERLEQAGAKVFSPERDFAIGSVDNLFYLLTTFRSIQPDIVHFNSACGVVSLFVSILLDIPVVQHLRSAELHDYVEQLRSADLLIAVSEFVKREALRYDIPKDKVRVVFNGIDTDYFTQTRLNKSEIRRDLGLKLDAKVVLTIARFTPNKRHDLMLKAAEIIKKSIPLFHLVFVGEVYKTVEYYEAIRASVVSKGLAKAVTFLGFQRDIRIIEGAADVVVLCSDREPLG